MNGFELAYTLRRIMAADAEARADFDAIIEKRERPPMAKVEPITTIYPDGVVASAMVPDMDTPGAWRVEAEDADGGFAIAVFSGPNARHHASMFAHAAYGLVVEAAE